MKRKVSSSPRVAKINLDPTDAQIAELDRRAAEVLKNPRKLRPLGNALRRLVRTRTPEEEQEQAEWDALAAESLGRMYGPDEAEYTLADLREPAIEEGIRRLEDLVTGKVRGLTEKQFRRSLRK
jgi:hypothetical protein